MRLFPRVRKEILEEKVNFNTTKVRLFPGRADCDTARHRHFNTTKVRLFLSMRNVKISRPFDFNTTKVRLFRRMPYYSNPTFPVFQYHKGAIISRALRRHAYGAEGNFNTTKVRLFQACIQTKNPGTLYFNTTKVRLFRSDVRRTKR